MLLGAHIFLAHHRFCLHITSHLTLNIAWSEVSCRCRSLLSFLCYPGPHLHAHLPFHVLVDCVQLGLAYPQPYLAACALVGKLSPHGDTLGSAPFSFTFVPHHAWTASAHPIPMSWSAQGVAPAPPHPPVCLKSSLGDPSLPWSLRPWASLEESCPSTSHTERFPPLGP